MSNKDKKQEMIWNTVSGKQTAQTEEEVRKERMYRAANEGR
jgi:hypothetical protein